MTLSLWRYSHVILAVTSSLFLGIASLTGVILALEPISHQAKNYAVQNLDEVTLQNSITAVTNKYDEVFSLVVESSGFVKASVLTEQMEMLDVYIDAKTGDQLGVVQERPFLFRFATNLHRSLFLKGLGRFFIGLTSVILLLISVTGIVLLAKRQGGFKRIFSKIHKDYFALRFHVLLSRWFFIPIVVISLSGMYLSAATFNLLPTISVLPVENTNVNHDKAIKNAETISFLESTPLSEVRKVAFPFSKDPEDFYEVELKTKTVKVNHLSGAIISSAKHPFVQLVNRISWVLHTGEGSVWWSIVLLFTSGALVFFMYTGFVMTLKRKKRDTTITAMPEKDVCEWIILIGSETGSTHYFATKLYHSIRDAGKKVYVTTLNNYTVFNNATHIIILTATYGDGKAPTNARNFETIFPTIKQPNIIKYAVVGFGSLAYPEYCKFAIQVDALLQSHVHFIPLQPLYKINNASASHFTSWLNELSKNTAVSLRITATKNKPKKHKKKLFKVIDRTALNVDNTFVIRLKPTQRMQFTSGDLLSIVPQGTTNKRQYSIAKIGSEIVLSIKKHDFGKGSSFIYRLNKGDILQGVVEKNLQFHFPKKTPSAVLIANGTGIAPFLGMMATNKATKLTLFWGGKTKASTTIYNAFIHQSKHHRHCFTYSREGRQQYVQEAVLEQKELLLKNITNGGVVMICGSLAMQHDVLNILENLLKKNTTITLDDLKSKGQLKMDCY